MSLGRAKISNKRTVSTPGASVRLKQAAPPTAPGAARAASKHSRQPQPSSGTAEPGAVIFATVRNGASVIIRFRNLTEAGDFLIRAGGVGQDVL